MHPGSQSHDRVAVSLGSSFVDASEVRRYDSHTCLSGTGIAQIKEIGIRHHLARVNSSTYSRTGVTKNVDVRPVPFPSFACGEVPGLYRFRATYVDNTWPRLDRNGKQGCKMFCERFTSGITLALHHELRDHGVFMTYGL
jgi:hypothetical protein